MTHWVLISLLSPVSEWHTWLKNDNLIEVTWVLITTAQWKLVFIMIKISHRYLKLATIFVVESFSRKYRIPDIERIFADFFVCGGYVSAHLTILNGPTGCEHNAVEVPRSAHKTMFRSFLDLHIRFYRRTQNIHVLGSFPSEHRSSSSAIPNGWCAQPQPLRIWV